MDVTPGPSSHPRDAQEVPWEFMGVNATLWDFSPNSAFKRGVSHEKASGRRNVRRTMTDPAAKMFFADRPPFYVLIMFHEAFALLTFNGTEESYDSEYLAPVLM
jgi:hypothetical protein